MSNDEIQVETRVNEFIARGLELYGLGNVEGALVEWKHARKLDPSNQRVDDYIKLVEDHYNFSSGSANEMESDDGPSIGERSLENKSSVLGDSIDEDVDAYELFQIIDSSTSSVGEENSVLENSEEWEFTAQYNGGCKEFSLDKVNKDFILDENFVLGDSVDGEDGGGLSSMESDGTLGETGRFSRLPGCEESEYMSDSSLELHGVSLGEVGNKTIELFPNMTTADTLSKRPENLRPFETPLSLFDEDSCTNTGYLRSAGNKSKVDIALAEDGFVIAPDEDEWPDARSDKDVREVDSSVVSGVPRLSDSFDQETTSRHRLVSPSHSPFEKADSEHTGSVTLDLGGSGTNNDELLAEKVGHSSDETREIDCKWSDVLEDSHQDTDPILTTSEEQSDSHVNQSSSQDTSAGTNWSDDDENFLESHANSGSQTGIWAEIVSAAPAGDAGERAHFIVGRLLANAIEKSGGGDADLASKYVIHLLDYADDNAVAQKLVAEHERKLIQILVSTLGDLGEVLMLLIPMTDIPFDDIDHRAAFLLTRMDGSLSLEEVLDVSGMPRLEALRHLTRLFSRGYVGTV